MLSLLHNLFSSLNSQTSLFNNSIYSQSYYSLSVESHNNCLCVLLVDYIKFIDSSKLLTLMDLFRLEIANPIAKDPIIHKIKKAFFLFEGLISYYTGGISNMELIIFVVLFLLFLFFYITFFIKFIKIFHFVFINAIFCYFKNFLKLLVNLRHIFF